IPFCISSPGAARNPEKLLTTPIFTTVCAAAGGGMIAASAARTGKNPQFVGFEAIGVFLRVSWTATYGRILDIVQHRYVFPVVVGGVSPTVFVVIGHASVH